MVIPEYLKLLLKILLIMPVNFLMKMLVLNSVITDKFINIIISDKGIGIPANEVESIYKPFKRASNVKFIGGFGIGLSLVSKILELHKAELKINTKVNEGTRIEILFKRWSE